MSGSAEIPHVILVGDQTRRLVEAINVVTGVSGTMPTIVGGLAVLCRVRRAHRATADQSDPVIARDAALHANRWFVDQSERSLRLIRAAGGTEVGHDEIALVADLLATATQRD